jgi:hypothetical protein
MDQVTIRRGLLVLSGLTFLSIAAGALVAPHLVAPRYGYSLQGVESFNEFRAVFVGFWTGLGITLLTASRRTDVPLLGDLCGLMILLQSLARAVSFVIDGIPAPTFVGAFALELITGASILLLRPREMASDDAGLALPGGAARGHGADPVDRGDTRRGGVPHG